MPKTKWLKNLTFLLVEAPIESIEACKSQFANTDLSHNERNYEMLTYLVLFVHTISESPDLLQKFVAHRFWKKKPEGELNLPRLAARFVLGATTTKGARYEQARVYGHVVQHYVEQSLLPEDIFEDLSKKTIYGVFDELDATNQSDGRSEDEDPDGDAKADLGDDANEENREDGDDQDTVDQRKDEKAGDKSTSTPRRFDPSRDIVVDAGEHMEQCLSAHDGEFLVALLLCTGHQGSWASFRLHTIAGPGAAGAFEI